MINMKYNLIYFDANQLEDYFFNEDYEKAYNEFLNNSIEVEFLIFTGREKDGYLVCLDPIGQSNYHLSKEEVNKIWIRGKNFDYEKYKNFDVINTQLVELIADNKNKTYKYLKDLMPKSQLIWWNNDVQTNDEYPNKYPVILKPLNELKGNGILKFDSEYKLENWFEDNEPEKPFILQEFIECVDYELLGIKGTHDIRLIIVNSEIVGLAVRQPKDDGWLCNVAQGGSIEVYDWRDLDDGMAHGNTMGEMTYFKNQVISKLPKDFKSAIFSIDFCNTKDGFKIFELNSYPGIRLEYQTYIEKVKELLNK